MKTIDTVARFLMYEPYKSGLIVFMTNRERLNWLADYGFTLSNLGCKFNVGTNQWTGPKESRLFIIVPDGVFDLVQRVSGVTFDTFWDTGNLPDYVLDAVKPRLR